jgi:uncharacterized membrane protein YphA (DoxX/SURF4 family)
MTRSSYKPVTTSQKIGKIFLHFIRIVVAIVFIFSGFVKLVDPLGFTYKIEDYLTAFGGLAGVFTSLALPAAIALSTFEMLLGLCMLFQIHLKRTAFFVLLFMLVMTPLTLWIALKNPVTDCGCFGDALIISNWETFYKNVILVVFILLILIFNKQFKQVFLPYFEWIAVLIFIIIGVGIAVYSLRNLPIIDFLPYKKGVNIPEAMMIPEGEETDKYETTFIYEKDGLQKEFTLANYPKGDSTWKFVDQKTVLVSKGYVPPIHDLHIIHELYGDITEDILHYEGCTYLLVMYDLNKASVTGAKKAEEFYQQYKNSTTKFYTLTASGQEDIENFRKNTGVTYPFCQSDPITLKTMVRSNPGLMLIKNGVIQGKWSWRNF